MFLGEFSLPDGAEDQRKVGNERIQMFKMVTEIIIIFRSIKGEKNNQNSSNHYDRSPCFSPNQGLELVFYL